MNPVHPVMGGAPTTLRAAQVEPPNTTGVEQSPVERGDAPAPLPTTPPERAASKGKRKNQRSGYYRLKGAVDEALRRGLNVLDCSTPGGRALAQWRDSLIADLGGREALTAQQLALVEITTRDKLVLDSVDYWLTRAPALVNRRKRALFPIVTQRAQLADSLTRRLLALGLGRRERPAPSIDDYLGREGEPSDGEAAP